MIRQLKPNDLETILSTIHKEAHFLYYSYLTVRKQSTLHYGQYTDQGELLGVFAFLSGLPFYAFSVFPVRESFCLRSMLPFMKEQLQLPNDAIGNLIVNEEEMEILSPQLKFLKSPKTLLLMKHIHPEAVPPMDKQVLRLGQPYHELIESKMAEMHTTFFAREELQYPFYGVMEQQKLIAVGGYHIYSEDYVELGNIETDAAWRRRGYGKKICTELTRTGRAITPNVYLNVLEENEAAIRLYQSIGYEVIRTQYITEFIIES